MIKQVNVYFSSPVMCIFFVFFFSIQIDIDIHINNQFKMCVNPEIINGVEDMFIILYAYYHVYCVM